MLRAIREHEEVILYNNILHVSEQEQHQAIDFLNQEYQKESIDYPHKAPSFDSNAALWGAKTLYHSAQLVLYRENKDADLEKIIPNFSGEITPNAILSADLCLRFIPEILTQLKLIDAEDKLIEVLEKLLEKWHYSGISHEIPVENFDFNTILSDACVRQLYINRIIDYKNLKLATHPALQKHLIANLGIHGNEFWKAFQIAQIQHEQY